ERARTGTLDEPDRGGNIAHPRAADDFPTIRARMEEPRREREGAAVAQNRPRISRAGTAEKQRDIRQSLPIVKRCRPLASGTRWILGKTRLARPSISVASLAMISSPG